MKTRREFVEFITYQRDRNNTREKGGAWHYGVVELRELADFLYDGPPTEHVEKLLDPLSY